MSFSIPIIPMNTERESFFLLTRPLPALQTANFSLENVAHTPSVAPFQGRLGRRRDIGSHRPLTIIVPPLEEDDDDRFFQVGTSKFVDGKKRRFDNVDQRWSSPLPICESPRSSVSLRFHGRKTRLASSRPRLLGQEGPFGWGKRLGETCDPSSVPLISQSGEELMHEKYVNAEQQRRSECRVLNQLGYERGLIDRPREHIEQQLTGTTSVVMAAGTNVNVASKNLTGEGSIGSIIMFEYPRGDEHALERIYENQHAGVKGDKNIDVSSKSMTETNNEAVVKLVTPISEPVLKEGKELPRYDSTEKRMKRIGSERRITCSAWHKSESREGEHHRVEERLIRIAPEGVAQRTEPSMHGCETPTPGGVVSVAPNAMSVVGEVGTVVTALRSVETWIEEREWGT